MGVIGLTVVLLGLGVASVMGSEVPEACLLENRDEGRQMSVRDFLENFPPGRSDQVEVFGKMMTKMVTEFAEKGNQIMFSRKEYVKERHLIVREGQMTDLMAETVGKNIKRVETDIAGYCNKFSADELVSFAKKMEHDYRGDFGFIWIKPHEELVLDIKIKDFKIKDSGETLFILRVPFLLDIKSVAQ